MSVPSPRASSCRPSSLAWGSALVALLFSSLALAADTLTPAQKLGKMDKASQQIAETLVDLDFTLDKKDENDHLAKAKSLLVRARAELGQAQGQSAPAQ